MFRLGQPDTSGKALVQMNVITGAASVGVGGSRFSSDKMRFYVVCIYEICKSAIIQMFNGNVL